MRTIALVGLAFLAGAVFGADRALTRMHRRRKQGWVEALAAAYASVTGMEEQ